MKPAVRDFAIRDIGCIVCRELGLGFVPAEKHHLTTTGRHGTGKRRGEAATIGVCSWHHRGVIGEGYTRKEMADCYGPGYALQARAFREIYGSDDDLLAEQDRLIANWQDSIIGRVA